MFKKLNFLLKIDSYNLKKEKMALNKFSEERSSLNLLQRIFLKLT